MKKYNLFAFLLLSIFFFLSCSGDDAPANDIIIGKWRAIEYFESNVSVNLPASLKCTFLEYTADNRLKSDMLSPEDLPTNCTVPNFISGITWSNLGNNQYRVGFPNDTGNLLMMYKEGTNLVQERSDGNIKIIYEPYES